MYKYYRTNRVLEVEKFLPLSDYVSIRISINNVNFNVAHALRLALGKPGTVGARMLNSDFGWVMVFGFRMVFRF